MMKKGIIPIIVGIIAIVVVYTQITIFVVQPIGAIPDGTTIVMLRGGKMQFVDSADAMCDRIMGGVSLLCRAMTLGTVAEHKHELFRLPYIPLLYTVSTGGKDFRG